MDNHKQKLIFDYVENSLNLLPKLIQLKTLVYETEIAILPLNNIILSYFFQCFSCKQFFNDDAIITNCHCELYPDEKIDMYKYKSWCKYCACVNIIDDHCNSCIGENAIILNNKITVCCIFPECKNDAEYGSITQTLFCSEHIKDHTMFIHKVKCLILECCKTAMHISKNGRLLCTEHSDKKNGIMFIKEGKLNDEMSLEICTSCGNKCMITHTCYTTLCTDPTKICNMKRCYKCARLELFIFRDIRSCGIFCSNCINNYDVTVQGYNYEVYDRCSFCCQYGKYYNLTMHSFHCSMHAKFDDVLVENSCNYSECYATSIAGIYCKFHMELSKIFNKLLRNVSTDGKCTFDGCDGVVYEDNCSNFCKFHYDVSEKLFNSLVEFEDDY